MYVCRGVCVCVRGVWGECMFRGVNVCMCMCIARV